ncbi:hypothetical protein C6P45_000387 [Maudiozyma exigua]|uniref:Uncharacterized protein n=1 Tax=Maudiozyma exigua TaxID=34358 RepID=A0A9P6WFW9_MAUEX|nr:hypothetical protein C6P45_000387 [Kazachstania exigua]
MSETSSSYRRPLQSLQRKTRMANKTFQNLAAEITIYKFESYEDYFRKNAKNLDYQGPEIEETTYIIQDPVTKYRTSPRRSREPSISKKFPERRSVRISRLPKAVAYEKGVNELSADTGRVTIRELAGRLVRPIRNPNRRSDWTISRTSERYKPDSLADAEEFGFRPLPLKTLLQTKQMKQVLRQLAK